MLVVTFDTRPYDRQVRRHRLKLIPVDKADEAPLSVFLQPDQCIRLSGGSRAIGRVDGRQADEPDLKALHLRGSRFHKLRREREEMRILFPILPWQRSAVLRVLHDVKHIGGTKGFYHLENIPGSLFKRRFGRCDGPTA